MDFSDFLVDYVDKYYIKTTEMFNIVSIILGMFIGLIAISNYIPNFPWFLPKDGVIIIILIMMIVGLKLAPRSGMKTNRKVLEIKRCVMVDPQHVNNLDRSKRLELLNQLELVFEKKDENALENCKNILIPNNLQKVKVLIDMMRDGLDEDLRKHGYDAHSVKKLCEEQSMNLRSDFSLMKYAEKYGMIVVTEDKDNVLGCKENNMNCVEFGQSDTIEYLLEELEKITKK